MENFIPVYIYQAPFPGFHTDSGQLVTCICSFKTSPYAPHSMGSQRCHRELFAGEILEPPQGVLCIKDWKKNLKQRNGLESVSLSEEKR